MTVAGQARALMAMVACGAALGAAYDLLCLLRRALHAGWMLTGMLDMLWGALGALAVIAVGLWLRIDLLRGYVLAGVLAGLGVYALMMGLPVRRVSRAVRKRWKRGEKEKKRGRSRQEKTK